MSETSKTNAVGYGGVLGFCNTLTISLLIGPSIHEPMVIGILVFAFGIIPALITGMTLGKLADATARYPVWFRLIMIALPAVSVLLGMGWWLLVNPALLAPAIIPTLVCAALLERRTRYRELLPAATLY